MPRVRSSIHCTWLQEVEVSCIKRRTLSPRDFQVLPPAHADSPDHITVRILVFLKVQELAMRWDTVSSNFTT